MFLVGLLMYGYISSFTRFILDDFCMGQSLNQYGFWGAQKWWYLNWDGRYVFTFLIHLAVLTGPRILRFFPLIVLVANTALLSFIGYYGLANYKVSKGNRILASLLMSTAITFWTLSLTSDVSESFYWVSSMLTYYLPITVALGGILALILFDRNNKESLYQYIIIGVIFFLSTGSSETFSVIALILAAVATLFVYIKQGRSLKSKRVRLLLCATIAILIGVLIMVGAPGNKIRQSNFPKPPSLTSSLDKSIDISTEYFSQLLVDNKFAFIVILISGLIFVITADIRIKNKSKIFFSVFGITILMVWASYILSIYATSSGPPNRVLIIPTFLVISFVFTSGCLLGAYMKDSKLSTNNAFVLGLIILVITFAGTYKSVRPVIIYLYSDRLGYAEYARSFDQFDQMLRSYNNDMDLVLDKYKYVNNHQAAQLEDPDHWINKCIAGYYQVKSVKFKQP